MIVAKQKTSVTIRMTINGAEAEALATAATVNGLQPGEMITKLIAQESERLAGRALTGQADEG